MGDFNFSWRGFLSAPLPKVLLITFLDGWVVGALLRGFVLLVVTVGD
jgi:hypothetical protein